MKKFSFITVVILVVILATCLVGCVKGDPIEFTDEGISLFSTEDHGRGEDYSAATLIKNMEDLVTFLEAQKTDYEAAEIEKITAEFFEERALIIVSHSVLDYEEFEFKKVAVDGDKLTVQLSRKRVDAMWYEVRQTFLSVKKSDVENVTSCSVVTSTTTSSFGFNF